MSPQRPLFIFRRAFTSSIDTIETATATSTQEDYESSQATSSAPSKYGDTQEEKEKLYEAYHQRIAQKDPTLTGADFVNQCKIISRDNSLSDEDMVFRIQSILRDMHNHYKLRDQQHPQRGKNQYSADFIKACNILIHVFIKQKNIASARQVFDGMIKSGTGISEITLITMIYGYTQQQLHKGNIISTTSFLSSSSTSDFYQFFATIEKYHKDYPSMFEPLFKNINVYYAILTALKDVKDTRRCHYYFKDIMQDKYGLKPDSRCYQTLMLAYRDQTHPQYEQIWSLFQEMKNNDVKGQPDKGNYSLVLGVLKKRLDQLTALAGSGKHYNKKKTSVEMEQIRARMDEVVGDMKHHQVVFNIHDYLCLDWDPLEALKEIFKKENISNAAMSTLSSRDYNTCLTFYMKKNQLEKALQVINFMKEQAMKAKSQAPTAKDGDEENAEDASKAMLNYNKLDQFGYGIIMDALIKDRQIDAAFDIYEEMKRENVPIDTVVLTMLMTACQQNQDVQKAMEVLAETVERYQVKPNIYTFNTLLSLVANDENDYDGDNIQYKLDRAKAIWSKMEEMDIRPDKRSFNNYISILARKIRTNAAHATANNNFARPSSSSSLWIEDDDNKPVENIHQPIQEMLKMYRLMKDQSEPDFITYSMMIHALSVGQHMRSAMQIYEDAKRRRIHNNTLSSTQLPSNVFNALMKGLQNEGKASEAMNVWYDMRSQGVLPDYETYDIVLEGCEQLGLTGAMETIRQQRRMDFDRLEQLDRAREQKRPSRK
ncbi:hypothetical protein BDF20DRAFT_840357 [Mycotypha africana]|uniref:uncharacterized protein n=1 Tax=Mycotypha africana TaxID=64632 RepID=UPI0022FFD80E|nr:uncharacterized protein BDF20DRAFT_840357 [Mycotypha africana]KAI8967278.1 hypothetical protein BDF20DRAFT_840357 [Mycotypha africana]